MKVELDEDFNSRPDHIDHHHEGEMIEFERLLLKERSKQISQQGDNHIGLALSGGGDPFRQLFTGDHASISKVWRL